MFLDKYYTVKLTIGKIDRKDLSQLLQSSPQASLGKSLKNAHFSDILRIHSFH